MSEAGYMCFGGPLDGELADSRWNNDTSFRINVPKPPPLGDYKGPDEDIDLSGYTDVIHNYSLRTMFNGVNVGKWWHYDGV